MDIKSSVVIIYLIVTTSTIFTVTLPTFKKKLVKLPAVYYMIIGISFLMIFTQVYRLLMVWAQDEMKENDQNMFKNAVLSYAVICEITVYLYVLYELCWQIHRQCKILEKQSKDRSASKNQGTKISETGYSPSNSEHDYKMEGLVPALSRLDSPFRSNPLKISGASYRKSLIESSGSVILKIDNRKSYSVLDQRRTSSMSAMSDDITDENRRRHHGESFGKPKTIDT